jgi:hypothetical protein
MNQNQMAAPAGMMGGYGGQMGGNCKNQNMAGHGMPNQIYMGNQG